MMRYSIVLIACLTTVGCDGLLGTTGHPESVEDLTSLMATPTGVYITWTAPSADETKSVRLSRYEMRYSRSIMATREQWEAATPISEIESPKSPGQREIIFVSRLTADGRYFVGVRTVDANGSKSINTDQTEVRLPSTVITAPSFDALDFDSTLHSSQEWIGQQPVLINFWAEWCGPCKREMPALVALYDEITPLGVEIIGMAAWSELAAARDFADYYQVTWPQLMATRDIVTDWSIGAVPTTIFVKTDGTVLGRMLGTRTFDQFRLGVELLLDQSSPTHPSDIPRYELAELP